MFSAYHHFDEYLDQQLSKDQQIAFEQQLLSDTTLAAEFAAHKAMRQDLRRLYLKQRIAAAVAPNPMPDDLVKEEAISASIAVKNPTVSKTKLFVNIVYMLIVGILLVVMTYLLLSKSAETPILIPNVTPMLQYDTATLLKKTPAPFTAKARLQVPQTTPSKDNKEALMQEILSDIPPEGQYKTWEENNTAQTPNDRAMILRGKTEAATKEETLIKVCEGYRAARSKQYVEALYFFEAAIKDGNYQNSNLLQCYGALITHRLYPQKKNDYWNEMQKKETAQPNFNVYYPKIKKWMSVK